MRILTLVLILSFSKVAFSEVKMTFSEYQSDLKIKEVNASYDAVSFSGEIKASGTIVFRLDRLSDSEFGDPLFVDFIPDQDQLILFPEVISGFYAKKVERISLLGTKGLYQQLFGHHSKSTVREVRKYGTVQIEAFGTSIECDARRYYAKLIKFTVIDVYASINNQAISGC